MSDRIRTILLGVFLASCLYLAVSGCVYAVRHPWKTQTERFLDFTKVVTWQREPAPDYRGPNR